MTLTEILCFGATLAPLLVYLAAASIVLKAVFDCRGEVGTRHVVAIAILNLPVFLP